MNGFLGLPTDTRTMTFMQVYSLLDSSIQSGAAACFDSRFGNDARLLALHGQMLNSGGGAGRNESWQLRQWWVWRANLVGVEQANKEMDAYLATDHVTVLHALTLYGVTTAKPVQLTDELRLAPLDSLPFSRYSHWISEEKFSSLGQIHGATLPSSVLIVERSEPKIAEPAPGSFHFDSQILMHDAAILLNAHPGVCSYPAAQISLLQEGIPPGFLLGEGAGGQLHDVVVRASSPYKPIPEVTFGELIKAYRLKPPTERERLQRALLRLGQAKGRSNPHDQALDLGIALEMLLLNGDPPDQLSLSFRLRGAWLLGASKEDRIMLNALLKDIYQLRSKVAHEGFAKGLAEHWTDEAKERRRTKEDVAERIVRQLILRPEPSWNTLVLGEPSPP